MPVGEVNCQDRKNTMVARSRGAFSLTSPTWALDSAKTKVLEGPTFSPTFFCLPENCHSLHQALSYEDFPPPPFSLRGFLSSLLFPVYSTFPLLVILKPRVLWAAAVHSRKFHYPEGLGISEGPWMKDYTSACELEQLCF